MKLAIWDTSILLQSRLSEERTFERYTGMPSAWLNAYQKTQKAVAGFMAAYRPRRRPSA